MVKSAIEANISCFGWDNWDLKTWPTAECLGISVISVETLRFLFDTPCVDNLFVYLSFPNTYL